jgi:hypothetical protein
VPRHDVRRPQAIARSDRERDPQTRVRSNMTTTNSDPEAGKLRGGILMWLLGVPIPIILLIYLFRGCV